MAKYVQTLRGREASRFRHDSAVAPRSSLYYITLTLPVAVIVSVPIPGLFCKTVKFIGGDRTSPGCVFRSRGYILCKQNCKPGSVFDSHLSRRAVADALKPPPGSGRADLLLPHGVAPDRVYSGGLSPAVG
ncbi:hypothetical protein SDC9_66481 [bioreactor metagenome]|uniref:Uncharacterized protein n=1 Tax=bioreactor metagenome TaxID=1076179 RepID=A0A644Y1E1_9ZZZZ